LRYLEQLRPSITIGEEGELSIFDRSIEVGLPVVVAVRTLDWPHWGKEVTDHAVVVVGIDQSQALIYIHDPFFAEAPIEMTLIDFEIGWEEKERWYGVIGLAPPEE
jgi:hypothetical protein